MNHLKFRISKWIYALSTASILMTSCESIYDDLMPCSSGAEIRFVYDYNLESANAFPSQVDCLTLHIYDSDGRMLKTVTPSRDLLPNENWRLQLDLDPGKYRAIAYGGISCDDASFVHYPEPSTGSRYHEISMRLLSGKGGAV